MSQLYTSENLTIGNYRTYKALIAVKYSGKPVSIVTAEQGKTNQDKFFGNVPALESSDVNLFDSNAIAYYLSNDQLRGENESARAQVIQWLNFAANLWPAVFAWVLPAKGLSKEKMTLEAAKTEVNNILNLLNNHLKFRTYLVGERITLADISMAVTLLPLYQYVLEPSLRAHFGNVTRYFMTLINQKQFSDVIGKVELYTCTKKISAAAKSSKKEKNLQNNEPKIDEDLKPAPESKDPFTKFPEGNFNMDDFKRFYSNNSEDKSIPYFWEKFDKDNYSIWYCEYKYPEELTKVFMSCNLISGMFQRLDRMRKNAFSSMILFGEDNNSTISGIWVWKGPELAFLLNEDWTVDYESYEWKKLDPDDENTKTMVKEYFSWTGEFGGKKFNQGKIFK